MNKRWVWVLLLLSITGIFLYAGSAGGDVYYAKGILRLHILANSDSEEDQRVKLCVRDAVLEYIEANAPQTNEKAVRAWASAHLDGIEAVADGVLKAEGAQYRAAARMGIYDFPAKVYGDKTYPAGRYDALRISLGEASGHNWWCVIFPPLCLSDLGITAAPAAAVQTPQSAGTPGTSPSPSPSPDTAGSGGIDVNGIHFSSILWEWLFN